MSFKAPWLVPAFMAVLGFSAPATTARQLIAAEVPQQAVEEKQQIDDRQVSVWARKEVVITPKFGDDEGDVKSRELWYRASDGKAWGEWQKHGIACERAAYFLVTK